MVFISSGSKQPLSLRINNEIDYSFMVATYFYKGDNVRNESRWLVDDELVDTSNSVRAYDWAWVSEKLNELWNKNIEWSVEGIRVKLVRTVFTYFM